MLFSVSNFVVIVLHFLMVIEADIQKKNGWVDKLNEDNWDRMLLGEWIVEFYAPWCPACKALEPVWESLAFQKKELHINVGKVDVTDAPGLSGRFLVTALPTIFHVKDGIFRQYKSPRDKNSLIKFVSQKTWMKIDPIPSWKSPTSIQMSIISQFFRMSQLLRGIHNRLMEDFGLPTWGSYLIFAVATIILGTLLGLLIVCVIDFIYPPKKSAYQLKKKNKDYSGAFMIKKNLGGDEFMNDIKDDLINEEGTGLEEKSGNAKINNENQSLANSPNIRKRRTRKAD